MKVQNSSPVMIILIIPFITINFDDQNNVSKSSWKYRTYFLAWLLASLWSDALSVIVV